MINIRVIYSCGLYRAICIYRPQSHPYVWSQSSILVAQKSSTFVTWQSSICGPKVIYMCRTTIICICDLSQSSICGCKVMYICVLHHLYCGPRVFYTCGARFIYNYGCRVIYMCSPSHLYLWWTRAIHSCDLTAIYLSSQSHLYLWSIYPYLWSKSMSIGAWWLSGRFGALRLEGRRFESHSTATQGPLAMGKFFTHSYL